MKCRALARKSERRTDDLRAILGGPFDAAQNAIEQLAPSITIALASFASGAMPNAPRWPGRPTIVPAVCVP
ncbi:hypothetical protein QP185_21190 [Sphingomonas aerolata]